MKGSETKKQWFAPTVVFNAASPSKEYEGLIPPIRALDGKISRAERYGFYRICQSVKQLLALCSGLMVSFVKIVSTPFKTFKMAKSSNSGNQHVVPRGNQWAVTGAGNSRATVIVSSQQQAISIAKPIAQNQGGDVVIHGSNGQIRERNSYGNDPFPPKG